MEKSFSVTLSELRKEKHITQKNAAKSLGISQALLSHYEKGIRECNREFLVKAADFYGVSCDYLLGRTEERTGEVGLDIHKAVSGDSELSTETLERACIAIKEMLDGGADERLNLVIAAELYRCILLGIKAGALPEKWACAGAKPYSEFYLDSVAAASAQYAAGIKGGSPAKKGKDVPPCIETIAQAVRELLRSSFSSLPFNED